MPILAVKHSINKLVLYLIGKSTQHQILTNQGKLNKIFERRCYSVNDRGELGEKEL